MERETHVGLKWLEVVEKLKRKKLRNKMEISDIDKLIEDNSKKKAEIDAESKALLKVKKLLEKESESSQSE